MKYYQTNPDQFFKYHLISWDAGWEQIRLAPGFLTKDEKNEYINLLKKLTLKLESGIKKLRFLKD